MGILDAAGLSPATADLNYAPRSFAYAFMEKMERDAANVVIAVSGDSKSDSQGEWVGLLSGLLAARYPKFTVVQKNKTTLANTYDADVTVQTGTGGAGNTLTIYNWSQSGAGTGVGWSDEETQTTFQIAYPVAPDLFIIATGANDDMPTLTIYLGRLVRHGVARIAASYPYTTFAVALLNPHNPSDITYPKVLSASRELVRLAGQLGMGVLNLQRAWWDYPGGYLGLLVDTKHPNPAGSALLAQTAMNQLVAALRGPSVSVDYRRTMEEIYVPLMGGFSFAGTPTPAIQAAYGKGSGIAFSHGVVDSWHCPPVLLPWWWNSASIQVDWMPQVNGAGNVRFELRALAMFLASTASDTPVATASMASATLVGQVNTSVIVGYSPSWKLAASAKTTGITPGPNAPIIFKVSRLGTDALDTLAGDALIIGIHLIRES